MVKVAPWDESRIGDLSGRVALITGANSGLGLRSARVLADHGARVLLACRSATRGERARAELAQASAVEPELVRLDLADLASVRAAAATIRELCRDRLDILLNNAGLMAPPRSATRDGFEIQLGTNHLGHAALTWLLMPALRTAGAAAAAPSRVVTLSSIAARSGRIDLDDPNVERKAYNPATAYGQAKLANQVFALELNRRLQHGDEPVISIAAHPGYSATGLGSTMASSRGNTVLREVSKLGVRAGEALFAQGARMGALPQLYAATAPGLTGGEYIGPRGIGGIRGYPTRVRPLRPARDPQLGTALWELTTRLTQVAPDPEGAA